MRQAYKVWSGIAAGVFCLVAVVDLAGSSSRTTGSSPALSVAGGTIPTSTSVVPSASAVVPAGPQTPPATAGTVGVTKVIDGDTFETGGEKIRVLGIDACEMGTEGGEQARQAAQALLSGGLVSLRMEPDVDRDRYGRLLRYVDVRGTDYGGSMVVYGHTGVYAGQNDASPAYVTDLRSKDYSGRTCSASTPPAPAVLADPVVPDVDVPDVDVPDASDTPDVSSGSSSTCVKRDKNGRWRDARGRFCSR